MSDPRPSAFRVGLRLWRLFAAIGLCFGLGVAAGCHHTQSRQYLNENDKLRNENLSFRRTVQDLQTNQELHLAQIRSLEQQLGHTSHVEGVDPSDIPRVVSMAFGRLSGVIDTNGDGIDDTVRVYVRTLDQYGRFMPAIGPAEFQVVAIVPGQAPVSLANVNMTPQQFNQAYRSGLTGTHFTLQAPLGAVSQWQGVQRVVAKVTLTLAGSGVVVQFEKVMEIDEGD